MTEFAIDALASASGSRVAGKTNSTYAFLNKNSLYVILCAFTLLWTLYAVVSHGSGDVHNDMAEAYAWGQELQGGYFKHPPFWAWLTFGWYTVFPATNWSAYLFCSLNVTVGIYCVSRCAEFFLVDRRLQQLAASLLILMPAYTFLAMKMNANTIHLSVWPVATWVFLRLLNKPTILDALGLGVLASFAVLSKYNSVLFLACLLFAAMYHPQARRFWRSPLPLLVVIGGLPLIILHGVWIIQHDFLPLHYLEGLRIYSTAAAIIGAIEFVVAEILYATPAIATLVLVGYQCGMRRRAFEFKPMNQVLLILAFGPMVLTAVVGAILHTRSPALWGLQNLFLWPVVALQIFEFSDVERVYRHARLAVLAFLGITVLAAPVVAYTIFHNGERSGVDPRSEAARALTEWWRTTYHRPLRIVAGDENYALAATYYSPDHPSYYISNDAGNTPWITAGRIAEGGVLFICMEQDETCRSEARAAVPAPALANKLAVFKNLYGMRGPTQDIVFFALAPKQ